jgi:hypothetical protein
MNHARAPYGLPFGPHGRPDLPPCYLPPPLLAAVLECVADADDTTRLQERSIRAALEHLR